jgi:hypothetical protein
MGRSNETRQSTTDPEAKLARKGNNQLANPVARLMPA